MLAELLTIQPRGPRCTRGPEPVLFFFSFLFLPYPRARTIFFFFFRCFVLLFFFWYLSLCPVVARVLFLSTLLCDARRTEGYWERDVTGAMILCGRTKRISFSVALTPLLPTSFPLPLLLLLRSSLIHFVFFSTLSPLDAPVATCTCPCSRVAACASPTFVEESPEHHRFAPSTSAERKTGFVSRGCICIIRERAREARAESA